MSKQLSLSIALLLATGAVSAQSGKVKVKVKPGRTETPAAASAPAAAPTDWSLPYAATITPAGLKADLDVLASDAYEGRETGKKGQKMAADYIAKAFAADGLAGPVAGSDNPYIQHFSMVRTSLDAPASSVKVGGKAFVANRDFYTFSVDKTFATATPVQPVFAGFGIREEKYSDFAAKPDYTGKDVVLLLGEPTTAAGKSLIGADGKPSDYAAAGIKGLMARQTVVFPMKARTVVLVLPSAAAFAKVPVDYDNIFSQVDLTFPDAKPHHGLNVLLVSPEMGAALRVDRFC